MTGTWINFAGIIIGGLLGVLLKKGIPQHINEAIMRVEGLAIGLIALNGIFVAMFRVTPDGRLSDSGGIILLISLVVGCIVGEALKIHERIERFGYSIEKRFHAAGFANGFVTATLAFCIGAMAIMGALYDGLYGDSTILITKTILDFTTSVVLASALGIGVAFSAIPVLVIQGSISLLAKQLESVLQGAMLDSICMVGYSLVLCIGLNFLLGAKIKVANLLPSLLIPIAYHLIW